jgi:ABC-type polysaccharide/polyol phosphate export permease
MENNLIYDSDRRGHSALEELREVFNFRNLIGQLVRRDILTRYKRSVLGVAWTMLNPLGMMLVWTLAFSQIFDRAGSTPGYAAYVLNGILAWTFFSQSTTAAMINFVWGGGLLNRIYVPRTSFALAAVGTALVNLALSLIPMLVVILAVGLPITPAVIFTPMAMILLAAFALGVGLFLSALAVFFPDVSEMYQIILQAWMFLTPIMYPAEILPEKARIWLTHLNPMFYFVRLYRVPLYYGRWPSLAEVAVPLLIAAAALVVGWLFFTSKSDEFAYRL